MHVALFSDITARKQADELIWKHANYDHLTQLPNRRLFRDRLDQSVKMAHRTGDSLALLFLDLDRFKEVNDTLGHDIGDKLLTEAAERINLCVREMDTVARMGGDEFTVILSHITDPVYAGKIAASIIQKLTEPFNIDGEKLNVSASIGITIYPADGNISETLLKNADIAMYAAKNSGRGRFSYFTDPT
jgi:diguanylate cyclase (GGDEF)-like protein